MIAPGGFLKKVEKNAGKVAIITQARMSSSRLPGKVMLPILGKPMLLLFLERLELMSSTQNIVVATTEKDECDIIEKTIIQYNRKIKVFRGSEEDVLNRYYQAAKFFSVQTIIRITSDCPLIDPKIADQTVRAFLRSKCDYCCNNFPPRTYPHGLDVEVFSFEALKKAWKEAKTQQEREHVTPYIRQHPEKFKLKKIYYKEKLGHLRWTVDYKEDYLFVKEVFEKLYKTKKNFGMIDILELLKKEPKLVQLNKKWVSS